MSGGKSSSSNTETNSQTTATATGTAGDVFQGQTFTINNELPDNVANAFGQLIDLTSQAVNIAAGAGQAAINTVSSVTENAKQPDIKIVETAQKQVMLLIGAGAAVVLTYFLFRSR